LGRFVFLVGARCKWGCVGGGGGGLLWGGLEEKGGGVTVLVPFVHHKSHTDWPGVEHKNNKKCMCL